MRALLWVGLMGVLTAPCAAQTVTKDTLNQTVTQQMQVLVPHIGGRVQTNPLGPNAPKDAVSYTHQWPGTYWEVGFDAQEVVLKFDDADNEYRLFIDALSPIPIAQPGRTEITVADLGAGPHQLRLEKVTESIWILGAFEGFYIAADGKALTAAPKPRQIEFIGDSDMTGYGLRSGTQVCTQDQVRLSSDAQAAYPALVAKQLDADYQINAISGRGMVRNYDGSVPDNAMAKVYGSIFPDQADPATPYLDPEWQPQIIFVALGNNDFFSPLHRDEVWPTHDALIDAYITGMANLLTTLHSRSRAATVILYWPDQGIMTAAEKARLDSDGKSLLNKTAQQIGMKPLEFIAMGNLELDALACHAHGSAADHRKKAQWLIDRINRQPDLWAGQ